MTREIFESAIDWAIDCRVLVEGAIIEFTIADTNDDARDGHIKGTLRFDGCMNLDTPTGLHFCRKEQAVSLGEVLARVYEIGKRELPYNDL